MSRAVSALSSTMRTFFPAADDRHLVTRLLQVVLENLLEVALVLDDQDPCHVLTSHTRFFGVE